MNKNFERLILGTTAAAITGAVVGCARPPAIDNITNITETSASSSPSIPSKTESVIPTSTPAPSLTPTPETALIPTLLPPYELPGGLRLDNTTSPVTLNINLPDNNDISETFKFNISPDGSGFETLCQPGDHTVCTYYAPNEHLNFAFLHSGHTFLGQKLEAETLREYIEGSRFQPNSPEILADRLDSLTGSQITLTANGQSFIGTISFAVRIPPEHVADFTRNFVDGPQVAAQIFADDSTLSTALLTPQDLYLQTCGRQLPGEKLYGNSQAYDDARLLIGIKTLSTRYPVITAK
jgi:hypothetical protein